MGELAADDEWQIINDNEHYPLEDYSTPERETDLEQSEVERRKNTNLRILEWMRDVKIGSGERQSIQQIDVSAGKQMKTEDPLFGWTATDRPLEIPPDSGTSAQEILPEYRLSQVHGGLELGIKGSQVRCWGMEQVKGS